jgi:methylenetetrahydrofolate reductase (NADPH)
MTATAATARTTAARAGAPGAALGSGREPLMALARGASLEVLARDRDAAAICRDLLPAGAAVFINHTAGDSTQDMVAAAARLARAGFAPVPHVAARHLESFTRLNDYLARAAGEAGVGRALVVAGDVDAPAGPYRSAIELLETGLFQKHGIRRVAIAGYPEGHPRIAAAVLDDALVTKIAVARRAGLECALVTQFCLEAAPIAAWIRRVRRNGIDCPIEVGLAGPASIATLAKFAVRCGIGNSIGALVRGQTSVARLVREAGPEEVVTALLASPQASEVAGLHFFTFGGVAATAAWLAAVARGDFTGSRAGDSFRVQS